VALYTKFHFGKHRGRRYDEIAATHPDYLRWIIEKSELEAANKHSARHWLAAQT
jgi:Exodeoxyribonuclease X-like C-terminal